MLLIATFSSPKALSQAVNSTFFGRSLIMSWGGWGGVGMEGESRVRDVCWHCRGLKLVVGAP